MEGILKRGMCALVRVSSRMMRALAATDPSPRLPPCTSPTRRVNDTKSHSSSRTLPSSVVKSAFNIRSYCAKSEGESQKARNRARKEHGLERSPISNRTKNKNLEILPTIAYMVCISIAGDNQCVHGVRTRRIHGTKANAIQWSSSPRHVLLCWCARVTARRCCAACC
jgi:hypothetical protein